MSWTGNENNYKHHVRLKTIKEKRKSLAKIKWLFREAESAKDRPTERKIFALNRWLVKSVKYSFLIRLLVKRKLKNKFKKFFVSTLQFMNCVRQKVQINSRKKRSHEKIAARRRCILWVRFMIACFTSCCNFFYQFIYDNFIATAMAVVIHLNLFVRGI